MDEPVVPLENIETYRYMHSIENGLRDVFVNPEWPSSIIGNGPPIRLLSSITSLDC